MYIFLHQHLYRTETIILDAKSTEGDFCAFSDSSFWAFRIPSVRMTQERTYVILDEGYAEEESPFLHLLFTYLLRICLPQADGILVKGLQNMR